MTPTRPQQQGNFRPSGDVQGRRPPFGSPGAGTSGGLQTGNSPGESVPTDSPNTNTFVLPDGTVVPWSGFPGGQPPSQAPNQNMLERYRQYQSMQRMLPQLPPQFQQQAQSSWAQLPGWAGYLQWLQMMRPQPGIPGGVPGPTRLPLGGYPTTAGG